MTTDGEGDGGGRELRKLQLTGGGSLAVTVPKPWIARAGLRAGDVVGCEERGDGSLVLTAGRVPRGDPVTLTVAVADEPGGRLRRRLVMAYVAGFDLLHLTSDRPMAAADRARARQALDGLIGLEVVDEGPASLTVQDFLDPVGMPLDRGVRRLAGLAGQAREQAAAPLGKVIGRSDLAATAERRAEAERLALLVAKQVHAVLRDPRLARRLGTSPADAAQALLLARLADQAAEVAAGLARDLAPLEGKAVEAAVAEALCAHDQAAVRLLRRGLGAFVDRDPAAAEDALAAEEGAAHARRAALRALLASRASSALALAPVLEAGQRTALLAVEAARLAAARSGA